MQQHPLSLPRRARLLRVLAAAFLGCLLTLSGAGHGAGGPAGILATGDPLSDGQELSPKEVNSTAGYVRTAS
ncbi:hypothetical protein [Streptomyces sp. NPDC048442]|uniref:hypothetical protein n=1 Tax=Streptomyces sp. NPDC048442 TaxID=3154823 RepID=UPI00341A7AC1